MRLTTLRTRVLALCAAVSLAALTACGPAEQDAPSVTEDPGPLVEIAGTGGAAPDFTYSTPLEVEEPVTEVVWEGDGDELVEGEPVLLSIYSEDGTDETVVRDDFTSVPHAYLLTADAIGADLFSVLVGQTVGSRVLHVVEAEDVPLVMSIDILPSRAVGTPATPEEGLPTVERDEDGAPTVTIPVGTEPPTTPVVRQVVRGTGDQVTAGRQVVIQYVAHTWSTGEVFDTTWGADLLPKTVTLGTDALIEGLDEGLLDLPVGSQVIVVVPPDLGFGPSGNDLAAETLVYVVDILAVSAAPPA